MCKQPTVSVKSNNGPRILYSLDSFATPPSYASTALTVLAFIVFISATQVLGNLLLDKLVATEAYANHPILTNVTYRQILARHICTDALSCFILAFLGYKARQVTNNIYNSKSWSYAAYDKRLFTYTPESFRIAVIFLAYQIRNLYDTILWDDGPEFIFHHVFSIVTALIAMYPGAAQYYGIFFFGQSELSTAVLCVLANFDAIPELGTVFPTSKIAIGVLFIVLFILLRCILWPFYSYRFVKDTLTAIELKQTRGQKGQLWFLLVSLSGLSILQVAWLGQIYVIAKKEIGEFLKL